MKTGVRKALKGKSCYGHLGGTLGNRLFERMLELGWFAREDGKQTVYAVTDQGEKALGKLGVDIYEKRGQL
jgi:predicted transcriptional regulator